VQLHCKRLTITPAADLYHHRAYLETLLTYGSDAALSLLTNTYWYLNNGEMVPCDPTAQYKDATIKSFIARRNRIKQIKEVELLGRSHSVICNVATHFFRRSDTDKIDKGPDGCSS
jgi:hypothetical protein